MSIRVVLADGHKILREGLRSLLARESDIEIIAEAEDGLAAIKLTLMLIPDVLVINSSMPNINGIDVTREIVRWKQTTRILIFSLNSDEWQALEALKVGASGYLIKDSSSVELIEAIRTVALDRTYFNLRISSLIVKQYARGIMYPDSPAAQPLTARERMVLQLITEGYPTKQVAQMLGISVKTAETHRSHIMRKLSIGSVPGLVKYAIREGIISSESTTPQSLPIASGTNNVHAAMS
jgi:DNA-binding NarL/FixJ family response regulator